MRNTRNYIHSEKLILWLPMRTGARYTHGAFCQAGFDLSTGVPTHQVGCDGTHKDYDVVLTVRNPYRRVLSMWAWQNIINKEKLEWDEWMDKRFHPNFSRFVISKELGRDLERVTHLVKLESIYKDIQAIPCFPENFDWAPNYFKSADLEDLDVNNVIYPWQEKLIWKYFKKDFKNFG